MNDRNKRVISILTIFTIIFTVMGGSLAYWNWSSSEASRTGVAFTIDKDFSCSADGGGHITPANISLEPSTCTNPNTSIKRKIVVTPDINKNGLEISLDMWLNINSIGSGLSNSVNLKYVLTTSDTSCEEGTIISKGNFSSKTSGDRVMLLEKNYTADASEPYYLYIWLDKEETSSDTMNQSFDFSLGGNCSNYVGEPEAPVLDPAMIPVTIDNNGKVTTVSKDDPNWYNYSNKEWANIVLVNENATEGVTDSHSRSYYQNNIGEEVTQDDILAYYVWIPRYKYKISTNKYCYDIENPTKETYPECYGAPYTLTISEEEAKIIMASKLSSIGGLTNEEGKCPTGQADEFGGEIYKECSEMTEEELNDVFSRFDVSYDTAISELLTIGKFWNEVMGIYISIEEIFHVTQYKGTLSSRIISSGTPTSIDIIFESNDEDMILGNATTEYRSHPAFWWDEDSDNILDNGEMLSGIWFAKFEPIPVGEGTMFEDKCFDYDDDGTDDVCGVVSDYIPGSRPDENTLSWGVIEGNGLLLDPEMCKNTFGIVSTDIHNFKIRDWGAVSYLSHSKYGINKEVRINNYYNEEKYETLSGCGASSDNAQQSDECAIKYGSGVSEYPQSTTGNITGVFDMSGGIQEQPNIIISEESKNTRYYDFLDIYISAEYWDQTATPDFSTACDKKNCYGYSLTETDGWYFDSTQSDINLFEMLYMNPGPLTFGGTYSFEKKAGIFAIGSTGEMDYTNRYVIINN